MHSALWSVKVAPPRLQLNEVRRPRLLSRLDEAIERRVTLVCAGPGSGKTVLVNQWVRERSHRVVWVSLDPEDDGEARFWTLVQFALQRLDLVVDSTDPGSDPGRSLAEHAIDDLAVAAAQAEGLLVLVLDDVHVLNDQDVIRTLDAVVRHPPPNLRIVMTALHDPVVPLHRYRIRGDLSEIRAAELAMTTPEVRELLASHGIHLSSAQVEILANRTEGWVAGLRLSAMRMEGTEDPEKFVTDFAMDRGSIGEYLIEEVMSAQPHAVQKLLIRSSICDPISPPLADAICRSESARSILAELTRKNCFVMALDHEGERYRFHPLLREMLRHLLHREPVAVQRRCHVNAARWYAAEGDLTAALAHTLAAQDWAFCRDLLVRGAFEQLYLEAAVRPIGSIGRFVDATPPSGRDGADSAGIVAAQAAVSVAIGRYERAAALLETLEASHLDDPGTAHLAYAQLLLARQAGDLAALEAAAHVLIRHDSQGPFGTFAVSELGSGYLWHGSDQLADRHLKQALTQASEKSLHAIALRCLGRLAILYCTTGRVAMAEEFLDEGAAVLKSHPWIPEEFRVSYHLGGAEVAMLRADLDLYSRSLRLADDALAPRTDPALSYMATLIQAKALQSAVRYPEARDAILMNRGREFTSRGALRSRGEIMLLELRAQMGQPKKAIEKLEPLTLGTEPLTTRAMLALARAQYAARDVEAASRVLRRIVTSHPAAPLQVLVEALLLTSEIADGQGQETTAVEAATMAVELAAAERMVLPFIPAGPRLLGLLHRHPALTNLWPAPLEVATGGWTIELPASPVDTPLPVPLTGREVSILNWLTTTMTMAEIATELYVSTNTVKTHVAAIYRKLDATNRREAIARGRQLHLI
jgi:LuxR family maltose regulon positive regulatory protein